MSRRLSPGPHGAWWMDDRTTPWVITFRHLTELAIGPPVFHHLTELEPAVDLYQPAGSSMMTNCPPSRSVIVDL